MSELPYVNLNEAVGWVCVDCGSQNFALLRPVEDPEQGQAITEQIGVKPEDAPREWQIIPPVVSCSKCGTEARTCPHDENPMVTLEELVMLLTQIAEKDAPEEEIDVLFAHIEKFAGSAAWALNTLAEIFDEDCDDPECPEHGEGEKEE